MNIGIVTTWFERGAAYVSRAYAEALSSMHDVYIYARGGEAYGRQDPNWDGPNVTYGPRWRSRFFHGDHSMSYVHYYSWIQNHSIDLVIYNEQKHMPLVREFADLGVISGAYVDYYKRDTVKDFDAYDFVLCNTRRHLSVFEHHRRPIYVPWGTDTCVFRPVRESGRYRGCVFFHSAGYGGVNCRKGTDLLIRAFRLVRGDARLLIHSQVAASRYGEDTFGFIAADPRIEFIERTESAPGLYHLGNVYVYPSKLDGIGLSVPEALSAGLPVIATDSAPMNEFVRDGYSGLLVKVAEIRPRQDGYYWPETIADVRDLADKMQLYQDRPELRNAHGENARAYALEHLDWKKNASGLAAQLAALPGADRPCSATLQRRIAWHFMDSVKWACSRLPIPG